MVLPGLRRADLLADPAPVTGDSPDWWRPVGSGWSNRRLIEPDVLVVGLTVPR